MREGFAFGLPRGAPRSGGRKSLVKRPYHWPHSPIVVPFWGAYLESYRVIPKRNYYWVMLLKPKALQGHSDCPQQALGGKRRNKSTHNVGVFGPIILNIKEEPPPPPPKKKHWHWYLYSNLNIQSLKSRCISAALSPWPRNPSPNPNRNTEAAQIPSVARDQAKE